MVAARVLPNSDSFNSAKMSSVAIVQASTSRKIAYAFIVDFCEIINCINFNYFFSITKIIKPLYTSVFEKQLIFNLIKLLKIIKIKNF